MPEPLRTARKTLHRALVELGHAKDDEGVRQAAEKGWRAAREAVYAVLAAAGERPRGTIGADRVRGFEEKHLGGRIALADGYASAKEVLHGACFYDGEYESKESIERELSRVSRLLDDAEYALVVLGSKRRKR